MCTEISPAPVLKFSEVEGHIVKISYITIKATKSIYSQNNSIITFQSLLLVVAPDTVNQHHTFISQDLGQTIKNYSISTNYFHTIIDLLFLHKFHIIYTF